MLDLFDVFSGFASLGPGGRDPVDDLLITLSAFIWPVAAVGGVMWAAGTNPESLPIATAMLLASGASVVTVGYAGRGRVAAVAAALGAAVSTFCCFFLIAFAIAVLALF